MFDLRNLFSDGKNPPDTAGLEPAHAPLIKNKDSYNHRLSLKFKRTINKLKAHYACKDIGPVLCSKHDRALGYALFNLSHKILTTDLGYL